MIFTKGERRAGEEWRVEWRGQSMGSGAGAVAKPAAGGRGVEAGSVQQLYFAVLLSHQLVTADEL